MEEKKLPPKRIKVLNQDEFEAATSNEAVYGKYKGLFAYIELGTEGKYRECPKDDTKTQYRFFRNCNVEYSETEEQSESGLYQYKEEGISVVIYW